MKKKKSLEDSLRGHTAQLEEEGRIVVVGENKVSAYLKVAKECLDQSIHAFDASLKAFELRKEVGTLTPQEAALLLDTSKIFMDEENYGEIFSGFFKEVIGGSISAGYREFEFDLNGFGSFAKRPPFEYIWGNVNGDDSRTKIIFRNADKSAVFLNTSHYLDVIVESGIGFEFGHDVKNCSSHIKGDCGYWLGFGANNSRFIVEGYTEHTCGRSSTSSYFDLRGKVDSRFLAKEAKNSTFRIGGKLIGNYVVGARASDCKFISPHENVIKYLLRKVNLNRGNKIYRELDGGKLVEVCK